MSKATPESPLSVPRPPWWASATAAKVVLCLAVLCAYANSLPGAFVFDDLESIPENPSIRNIVRLDTVLSPPRQSTVAGRPILNLSLALNYAVDGLRVHGYHALNIALHILAALTLFGILRRTLELPSLSPRYRRASVPLAFAVSLLWALHPIQTGSVTYIIQRAESLMGLFYLLTIYCLLRSAQSTQPLRWGLYAVVSCALGMGTKEAMATAPIVALLYDRIFLSGTWRDVFRKRGPLYAGLGATWIILGVMMATTASRGGTVGFGMTATWWEYAATQFGVILHYLRLVGWPSPLVLDYGWPIATKLSQIAIPAIGVVILLCLTAWALWRNAKIGFLGAAFFLILAPTSSVVPIRDAAFEHRMYLPLACVLTFLVTGAHALMTRRKAAEAAAVQGENRATPDDGASTTERVRWVEIAASRILIASVLIAIAFGATTIVRNRDYRTEISIWQDAVKKRPGNWRAHDVLGIAYARVGDYQGAVESHTEALELNPNSGLTYYNRGTTYLNLALRFKQRQSQGDAPADMDPSELFRAAIGDFSESIRIDRHGDTYSNRALAYFQLGEYAMAKADVDSSQLAGFQPHPKFVQILEEALAASNPDSASTGPR